jgi:hypothetical protein
MTCANFTLSPHLRDGLRPELKALFERLAINPHSELFVRSDGMTQAGPDPISESTKPVPTVTKRLANLKKFGQYPPSRSPYLQIESENRSC